MYKKHNKKHRNKEKTKCQLDLFVVIIFFSTLCSPYWRQQNVIIIIFIIRIAQIYVQINQSIEDYKCLKINIEVW